jgi:hypothetical protein
LKSLAVRKNVAFFTGGGKVWETLGSANGGASGGKGDDKEENGGELHVEKPKSD